MGRKRRRKVRTRPKPSLPEHFECPSCGEGQSVTVEINHKTKIALITCGMCGIHEERTNIRNIDEKVDIYGDWIDEYYRSEEQS